MFTAYLSVFSTTEAQLTLTASGIGVSSTRRGVEFSGGLNTGLALTGGGGSLALVTRGLLFGALLLTHS